MSAEILEAQKSEPAAADSSLFSRNTGRSVGRSSAKRQRAVLQLSRKLQHETRIDRTTNKVVGPNQPCTLVNFNPLDLVVEMEGRSIRVPAAGRFETQQVKLQHAGRDVQGSYLFISAPIIYTTVTGHEADEQTLADVAVSVAKHFSPHAIGCAMYEQYNSPNMKPMGGVLLFDQDPRAITSDHLDRWEGRIWVPERTLLDDSLEFVYSQRETRFEDELDRLFEAQRRYCDMIIQKAHSFWTEGEAARKMITDTDRDWARYAQKMMWLKDLPEWVSSRISASGPLEHLVRCHYCGGQQPAADVLFCKACNAPYDSYKAFKWRGPSGQRVVVPQMYLENLEGEELEDVLAELRARRSKFAEFDSAPGVIGEKPIPSRPLVGAAKAAAEAKAAREAAAKADGAGE